MVKTIKRKILSSLIVLIMVSSSLLLFLPVQKAEAVSSLGVDGNASNKCTTATTCTVTLSTATTNDIILVGIVINSLAKGVASISDGSGLTWRLIRNVHTNSFLSVYWAYSAAVQTNDVITMTLQGTSASIVINAFAVKGADTSNPFDPNAALPVRNNAGSGTNASLTMSTSKADTILVEFLSSAGSGALTPKSGWTVCCTVQNTPKIQAQYKIVTSAQTSVDASFTWSASQPWSVIGFAIVASGYTPTIKQLSTDGVCSNSRTTAQSNVWCRINSTKTNGIFFAQVTIYNTVATTVVVSDSICPSWVQRYPNQGASGDVFLFFCGNPNAAQTLDNISAAFGAANKASIIAWSVNGTDFTSPWDSAFPLVSTATSTSPNLTITTKSPYAMVPLALSVAFTPSITGHYGYLPLDSESVSGAGEAAVGQQTYVTTLTNKNIAFTLGASQLWVLVSDPLRNPYIATTPTTPQTIDTKNFAGMTWETSQRKNYNISGVNEIWYYDTAGLVCVSTVDGSHYGSKVRYYTGGGDGGSYDVRFNSTNNSIFFVVATGGAAQHQFYVSAGNTTVNGCGDVTWSFTLVQVTTSNASHDTSPSITWDDSGNLWVATMVNRTNAQHILVYKCSAPAHTNCGNGANWSESNDITTNFTPYAVGDGYESMLVKLTGGKMATVYGGVRGNRSTYVATYSGSAWNSPVASTSNFTFAGVHGGDAVAIGDKIGISQPTRQNNLKFLSCSYPCSSINELTILSSGDVLQAQIAASGNSFYILWGSINQTTVAYIMSNDLGVTWSGASTITHLAVGMVIVTLNAAPYPTGGRIGFSFSDGATGINTTNYNVCVANACHVKWFLYSPTFTGFNLNFKFYAADGSTTADTMTPIYGVYSNQTSSYPFSLSGLWLNITGQSSALTFSARGYNTTNSNSALLINGSNTKSYTPSGSGNVNFLLSIYKTVTWSFKKADGTTFTPSFFEITLGNNSTSKNVTSSAIFTNGSNTIKRIYWEGGNVKNSTTSFAVTSNAQVLQFYGQIYRISYSFKRADGTTITPTNLKIYAPNNTLLTLTSFSSLYQQNGTWTPNQINWSGGNIRKNLTDTYSPSADAVTLQYNTRIYRVSYSFKNADGTTATPSQINTLAPNSTAINYAGGYSSLYQQNGTWSIVQILWRGTNVRGNTSDSYSPTTDPVTYQYNLKIFKISYAFTKKDGTSFTPHNFTLTTPNATSVTLTSYTNIYEQNGTWTPLRIYWENSNVRNNTSDAYSPTTDGTYGFTGKIYRITYSFKKADGSTVTPTNLKIYAPNSTLLTLTSFSSLYQQNGTWTPHQVNWEGSNVRGNTSDTYSPSTDPKTYQYNLKIFLITPSFLDTNSTTVTTGTQYNITVASGGNTTSLPISSASTFYIQNGSITVTVWWRGVKVNASSTSAITSQSALPINCQIGNDGGSPNTRFAVGTSTTGVKSMIIEGLVAGYTNEPDNTEVNSTTYNPTSPEWSYASSILNLTLPTLSPTNTLHTISLNPTLKTITFNATGTGGKETKFKIAYTATTTTTTSTTTTTTTTTTTSTTTTSTTSTTQNGGGGGGGDAGGGDLVNPPLATTNTTPATNISQPNTSIVSTALVFITVIAVIVIIAEKKGRKRPSRMMPINKEKTVKWRK